LGSRAGLGWLYRGQGSGFRLRSLDGLAFSFHWFWRWLLDGFRSWLLSRLRGGLDHWLGRRSFFHWLRDRGSGRSGGASFLDWLWHRFGYGVRQAKFIRTNGTLRFVAAGVGLFAHVFSSRTQINHQVAGALHFRDPRG
jgi:hypothetical protein